MIILALFHWNRCEICVRMAIEWRLKINCVGVSQVSGRGLNLLTIPNSNLNPTAIINLKMCD